MKQLIKLGIYICIILSWLLLTYTVGTADKQYLVMFWPLLIGGIGLVWVQDRLNKESGNG